MPRNLDEEGIIIDPEDGKVEGEVVYCTFHESVDGKKDVLEFNKAGSHMKIPSKSLNLSSSTISISLEMKFQDNNQDRINLFEGTAIPLAVMLVRKSGKYYLAASVHLSKKWHVTTADSKSINPNQWYKIDVVFTGEELFIFSDNSCIGRRIFIDAELTPVGIGDFFIGTWTDGRRNQFKGMISSLRIWDTVPSHFNRKLDSAVSNGVGEIESKYMDLGGESGFLGKKIKDEMPTSGFSDPSENTVGRYGRYCRYQNGNIYWSESTGAQEVHGSILVLYDSLGGPRSKLGFPRTDERNGALSGSKINRFENGAIYWTSKTGAHALTGHLYAKYIELGGETSYYGLPTASETSFNEGYFVTLQRGHIFYSRETVAHIVHGAILEKYLSFNQSIKKSLGFPTSDELDILTKEGKSSGKVSYFQGGAIYWSNSTGAHEVHGDIFKQYVELKGPSGIMGLPISNQLTVKHNILCNDFENGIILQSEKWGVRFFTTLELYLGEVVSGKIDDGIGDSSAELITYTTVKANNKVLDNGKRRPNSYAGSSYNINQRYPVSKMRHDTEVYFKVKIDDWDKVSSNDNLGTIEETFDISTLWGTDNGSQGTYYKHELTKIGSDAPSKSSVTLTFNISMPSIIDRNRHFRDQCWWGFKNFSGPKLGRDFFAGTFKDVEIIDDGWLGKAIHPMDTAIYELAYKNIAAKGNCFGMSLEALYAIKNNSLFKLPLDRYKANSTSENKYYYHHMPQYIYEAINRKQGYQIGSSCVSWTLFKLLPLSGIKSGTLLPDAVSPKSIFNNVKKLIDRADYPIISMMSISRASGHAVLAYDYVPGEKFSRIYVADPNKPYSNRDKNGNLGFIEIDNINNLFKFYPSGKDNNKEVTYESGKVLKGFLPDTYMMEIPYSIVSSQPTTPFLHVLLGLAGLVGGVLLLIGDAEGEQISSGTDDFYGYVDGVKRQKEEGIKGLARIPIFDGPNDLSEIYAIKGEPPKSLDLTVKGIKNGKYEQHFATHNNFINIEASIRLNERDHVHVSGVNSSRPNISLKTSGVPKNVKVSYESLNDFKKKEKILYKIDIQATKDESLIGIDRLGGGLIINQAGSPKDILIEKVFLENNLKKTQTLKLRPTIENEIIKLSNLDMNKAQNHVLIERIDSLTGKIIDVKRELFR